MKKLLAYLVLTAVLSFFISILACVVIQVPALVLTMVATFTGACSVIWALSVVGE